MPTTADYRRQAETCLSLALSSSDPIAAEKLKSMACDLIEKSMHPEKEDSELPPVSNSPTDAILSSSKT